MVDKTLIDDYEKSRREYEEAQKALQIKQQQLLNQFKSDVKSHIDELVTLYKQRQDEDKHIKTLQEELKKARENYAYLSQKFMDSYNSILNTAKLLPDAEKLARDTILAVAPELKNALSEKTKTTARSVSKFLSSQARYIDPFTGKTFVSWTDAVREFLEPKAPEGEELTREQLALKEAIENRLSSDSAHRMFNNELGYDLLTLNNQTIEEVNDCIDTAGCLDNIVNVMKKTDHTLSENEIIDLINNYLQSHPKEQI